MKEIYVYFFFPVVRHFTIFFDIIYYFLLTFFDAKKKVMGMFKIAWLTGSIRK